MHYRIAGLKTELDDVDRFLKEMGVSRPEEEASLKVTRGSVPEETSVVLLAPKTSHNLAREILEIFTVGAQQSSCQPRSGK